MLIPSTVKRQPLPKLELTKKALACHELGIRGGMTRTAEEFEVSRPTVYVHLRTGEQALEAAFTTPINPKEKLYAEVKVDRRQLERALIAMRVEGPNSIRDIVEIQREVYGKHLSFGTIQAILAEAECKAEAFNDSVDLSPISHVALDEMFSQQTPVLGGIDLKCGYTFLLDKSPGRSGDDWERALSILKYDQNLDPDVVVKDAGSGLGDGTSRVYPNAQQRDDLFHAVYLMNKVRLYYEHRCWGALSREDEAERKLRRAKPGERRKLGQQLRRAKERSENLMSIHDTFETYSKEARDMMEFIDVETGKLRTGAECAEGIRQVAARMRGMEVPRITKVAKYLKNRSEGLSLWVDELRVDLENLQDEVNAWLQESGSHRSILRKIKEFFTGNTEVAADVVSGSCWFWKLLEEYRKARNSWDKRELGERLTVVYVLLKKHLGKETNEVIGKVFSVIGKRYRASSLVESLNGLLRPYLYVHQGVTSGFLQLFMAYRNLKRPGCGKVRGPSPYEKLTGESVEDWLTAIGYAPTA